MADTHSLPLSEYIKSTCGEIDAALSKYSEFDADCPKVLRVAVRHSLLAPGKRLRPLLVLMSAEACGYDQERAMPAACSVEMVHTYSLIHDDLPAMDDDDLRRGLPACHAKYGEAIAILAGDALLARAFELLAGHLDRPQVAARCCAELAVASGASCLVGGQVADLTAKPDEGGLPELEAIHRRKTGALFRASMRIGAIVGLADDEQFSRLDSYGRKLGLAFQIVDDLLDVRGSELDMGKRIKKDDDRGKLTFPGLLGIEESEARAQQLIDGACADVASFGSKAGQLEALARYVLERNR